MSINGNIMKRLHPIQSKAILYLVSIMSFSILFGCLAFRVSELSIQLNESIERENELVDYLTEYICCDPVLPVDNERLDLSLAANILEILTSHDEQSKENN